MAEVVQHLNKWLGTVHRVSIVDRHESNGVEGTNKQLLRHLRHLVNDERIKDRWSDPSVLPLVVFHLNNEIHSETGISPFEATFGSSDARYYNLPTVEDASVTHEFVRSLNNDLRTIRDISLQYQQQLADQRVSITPESQQNVYQRGDIVLFHSVLPGVSM